MKQVPGNVEQPQVLHLQSECARVHKQLHKHLKLLSSILREGISHDKVKIMETSKTLLTDKNSGIRTKATAK